jgi:hypothetical protein
MFPDDYCSFLPVDLPVISNGGGNGDGNGDSSPTYIANGKRGLINVCAPGGGGRNQKSIVDMFCKIPYQEHDVTLTILTRRIQPPAKKRSTKLGLDHRVS